MPAKKKESKLWFHSKSQISHITKRVPPVNHDSKMYTFTQNDCLLVALIQTANLCQISSLNAEFTDRHKRRHLKTSNKSALNKQTCFKLRCQAVVPGHCWPRSLHTPGDHSQKDPAPQTASLQPDLAEGRASCGPWVVSTAPPGSTQTRKPTALQRQQCGLHPKRLLLVQPARPPRPQAPLRAALTSAAALTRPGKMPSSKPGPQICGAHEARDPCSALLRKLVLSSVTGQSL